MSWRSIIVRLRNYIKYKLYEFKIGYYIFKIFYEIHMVTTRERLIVITQKNMIKKTRHADNMIIMLIT